MIENIYVIGVLPFVVFSLQMDMHSVAMWISPRPFTCAQQVELLLLVYHKVMRQEWSTFMAFVVTEWLYMGLKMNHFFLRECSK